MTAGHFERTNHESRVMLQRRMPITTAALVTLICATVVGVTAARAEDGVSIHAQRLTEHPDHALAHTAPDAPVREASPRFRAADEEAAAIPGIPDARFWADSVRAFNQAVPQQPGDWLVLSEGGEDGAYGAGVLVGWTKAGMRPQFSVVTGVSTGALMAPFAFLGSSYDDHLRALYTGVTAADIFEAGATSQSLLDTWPLAELIERNVTAQMLADIAQEHQRGRRLFVVTTDLDAGRPMAWNMGAIAEHGEAGLMLFRRILLASASIPGVFPPVIIDVQADGRRLQEMHADGGATAPFYLAPQRLLLGAAGERLPAKRVYVVINGKLNAEFQVTDASTLGILGRSIDIALKSIERSEVAAVRAIGGRDGVGIGIASVDPGFSHESRNSFDPDYMKALFALGLKEGRTNAAFRTEPVAAPAAAQPVGPYRPFENRSEP